MSRTRSLEVTTGGRQIVVDLRAYLDPERAERAAAAANAWIKALRHVDVDGRPLRDRFTYRGDSLWWFAELFLHKQAVIQDAWDTALALDALAARERPTRVRALTTSGGGADPILDHLLPQAASRFGFRVAGDPATDGREAAPPAHSPAHSPAHLPAHLPAHRDATVADELAESRVSAPARARDERKSSDRATARGERGATSPSPAAQSPAAASPAVASPAAASPTALSAAGEVATAELSIGQGPTAQAEIAQAPSQAHASGGPTRLFDAARWRTDLRSHAYTWTALASRLHPRRLWPAPARWAGGGRSGGGVLAFVHSAFWRHAPDGTDEGEEGYIGAVLRELKVRSEAAPLRLVGVGPRTNFRARRWWHPLRPRMLDPHELPLMPIEDIASWPALAGSRGVWRDRVAIERALLGSAALRAQARIEGYDIWPILAGELRGIARLQFPWSARAMDEAAAALDACRPRLVVTYAEAGGWGRALILEARRRGIPSVGLQHGFIYRHWLNYLHAPDEVQPSPGNPADRGFPRPDLTLVYDDHAAHHLRTQGQFPEQAVRVTGSPALDALAASVAQVSDEARARVRAQLGAAPGDALVLVVSKFTQIAAALPALVAAVRDLPDVRLAIKPHPAETAAPYARLVGGAPRVTIAPPALGLAALLAAARLVVTVNSTVAIDAMTMGVPALVVGLPNNLSPFVEAEAMAGVRAGRGISHATGHETAHETGHEPGREPGDETGQKAEGVGGEPTQGGDEQRDEVAGLRDLLTRLTGDEAYHRALVARGRAFAAAHGIRADGQAAARAAEAIAALATGRRPAAPQSEGPRSAAS